MDNNNNNFVLDHNKHVFIMVISSTVVSCIVLVLIFYNNIISKQVDWVTYLANSMEPPERGDQGLPGSRGSQGPQGRTGPSNPIVVVSFESLGTPSVTHDMNPPRTISTAPFNLTTVSNVVTMELTVNTYQLVGANPNTLSVTVTLNDPLPTEFWPLSEAVVEIPMTVYDIHQGIFLSTTGTVTIQTTGIVIFSAPLVPGGQLFFLITPQSWSYPLSP
jgi:hypothetical protein